MPKRKAATAVPEQELRRSTRRKSGATTDALAAPQQQQTATKAKAKRAADDEPAGEAKKPLKSRKTAFKAKVEEDDAVIEVSQVEIPTLALIGVGHHFHLYVLIRAHLPHRQVLSVRRGD